MDKSESQKLWGHCHRGPPTFLSFILQNSTNVFTVNIREKSPVFLAGRGEKHSELCQNTMFFLTRPALRRNYFTRD